MIKAIHYENWCFHFLISNLDLLDLDQRRNLQIAEQSMESSQIGALHFGCRIMMKILIKDLGCVEARRLAGLWVVLIAQEAVRNSEYVDPWLDKNANSTVNH